MLLPRLCAAAEVAWCVNKDYARFDASLEHTFAILDAMDIRYSLVCRGLHGPDRQPPGHHFRPYLSAQRLLLSGVF